MTIQLPHLDTKKARECIRVSFWIFSMRGGQHRKRICRQREKSRGHDSQDCTAALNIFFCTSCISRQILGTNLEEVFMGTEFEAVRIILFSLYNGHRNWGSLYSLYCRTVGTEIKAVCTVSLARVSRQRIGRNFDCKISEFNQFAEHCGWDKFISVYAVLWFYCRK